MEYDFIKAVQEVIEECKINGNGKIQRKDKDGKVIIWLEAEWVTHWNGTHEVIELLVCYSDTGRIAYSTYIMETMKEKS